MGVSIGQERALIGAQGLTLRRREQWGARRSYTDPRTVEEPATRLFLHITDTNRSNFNSNDAHARGVEAIGIARFPNTGISYNALILPGGLLYEAQPWGRRGAHTLNERELSECARPGCPSRGKPLTAPSPDRFNLNFNSRAVSFAGGVGDTFTDADVRAAARWGAAYKLAGLVTRDAFWHGHRCAKAKACPGDKAFNRLGEIVELTETFVRDGLSASLEDDVTVEELLRAEISTGQGTFRIATLLANAALLPVIKRKGDELAAQIAEIERKLS
jgi:hypothetical protein